MLIREYRLPVIRLTSSGDLMYSMKTIANTVAIFESCNESKS